MAKRSTSFPVIWTYGLLATGAIMLAAFGWLNRDVQWGSSLWFAGLVGVMQCAACAPIAFLRDGGDDDPPRQRSLPPTAADPDLDHRLDRIEAVVVELRETMFLSEGARRLIAGDRDRETLHMIVERAVAAQSLDEARRLCEAIERDLGHADIAASGRAMIEQAMARRNEEQIRPLVEGFEGALSRRDWGAAYMAAGQIRTALPGSAMAQSLDARIVAARDEHKRQLEERFLEAARRDDVESAMSLLKELDRYLRRDEAERLARTAQEIITRHRDRLGAAFQLAVQERRWSDAARQGNAIIEHYPNTKMADEVRAMIAVIRTRATQAAVAADVGRAG